jgi:hypothetical protein
MTRSISRRTVLKGFGIAVGAAALGTPRPRRAEARGLRRKVPRCYVYLEHAASSPAAGQQWDPKGQWVIGALLVVDPRLPRQLLRRTKRHRLPAGQLQAPEISARQATAEFREHLYRLLASRRAKGLEAYSIRVSQGLLRSKGDQVGLFQLQLIQALLRACDRERFREILVYQNLPSLQGVSAKAFRDGLQENSRDLRVRIWNHDPAWDQGAPRSGFPRILPDEGLQVADFLTYAFYQKYQYGNRAPATLIAPIVRRELDARALHARGVSL